jgi:hypothetical protein
MSTSKYVLLIIISCMSIIVRAQDSTRMQSTVIGKVSLETGRVIKKEFIDIYKSEGGGGIFIENWPIEVKVINILDAATKLNYSGIIIGTDLLFGRTAFIDYNEISGFLNFIEMLNEVAKNVPKNYTEYVYNLNDLRLVAYQKNVSKKNPNPYWAFSFTIERRSYGVEIKVLNEIKNAISKNINLMVHNK